MVTLGGEPTAKLQAYYVSAKHVLRSLGYTCVRLPHIPVYRFTTAAIPLPGDLKRIYCYHARKTGGTTLAHAFLALGGEEPGLVEQRMKRPPFCTTSGAYRFAYQDPPLLRRGYFFFGYGHKPAELIHLPDQTFTITILRDPVDRVVSLYRYLADPEADEGHAFHSLAYEQEWAKSGFESFLGRVTRDQLLNQLYIFSQSGSVAEAAERILGCDCILFTENLDRGIGKLAAFLGLTLAPRQVRKSRFDYRPSSSETARLRELLEPEYQLLSAVAASAGEHIGSAGPPPLCLRDAPASPGVV
jgi:hypothetical protein